MSDKLETVSQFLHRFTQYIIVGLVSAVLYFVKDIHSEFKELKAEVIEHDKRIEVQKSQFDYLKGRVDYLSENCLKK